MLSIGKCPISGDGMSRERVFSKMFYCILSEMEMEISHLESESEDARKTICERDEK
jgi:hypothetical protein